MPETTDMGKPMLDLLKTCWAENVDIRPSFMQIRNILRKIAKGE
jgi:hypothetical protein